MSQLPKSSHPTPSRVIRKFESHSGKSSFLCTEGLPTEWRPTLIDLHPITEVLPSRARSAKTIIRLDNFAFESLLRGDEVANLNSLKKKLSWWVEEIDQNLFDRETIITDRVAHWSFSYSADGSAGIFNVWIVALGESSSDLIAEVVEW